MNFDTNKKLKFNSKFMLMEKEAKTVVLSLDEDENKVYTFEGLLSQLIVKIRDNSSLDDLKLFIEKQPNSPAKKDVDLFIQKFVNDLQKLNIII